MEHPAKTRISPALMIGAVLAAAGAASAQPLRLVTQVRTISASGSCCGLPGESASDAAAGIDAVFSSSVSIEHHQDAYNFYSAVASQATTVDQHGVRGDVFVDAGARGLSAAAASGADAVCDVTFDLTTACTYTFSASRARDTDGFWMSRVRLSRSSGVVLFNETIWVQNPAFAAAGTLEPGRYRFQATSSVLGTQLYTSAGVDFSFVVDPLPCPCDLDRDGAVGSSDFFAFVSDFFAEDADFDGSGATNSADFFAYLECFFSGCA